MYGNSLLRVALGEIFRAVVIGCNTHKNRVVYNMAQKGCLLDKRFGDSEMDNERSNHIGNFS